MPKKNSYITVKDQFCGAGGSSQGVRRLAQRMGGGIEVKVALNHWKLAIDTHNTNFPDTIHDCTDISAADPRRYPSTDILITSPECTNHSLAKGKKIAKKQIDLFAAGKLDPAAERSRATMWDVPRFAEYHKYNLIIVENVVDARKWVMFDAWLMAMLALGYQHKCVYLNSMHCHPTPQSRDRMYVVFWKKGNKAPDLEYRPAAHCAACGKDVEAIQTWKRPNVRFGKYRQQYVYCCPGCAAIVEPYYYAAFNCIDWSDLGQRIGDRKKPLSPKTVTRIEYGIDRYGSQPMVVVNYTPGYTKTIDNPLSAVTTQDHHGILTPFVVNRLHGGHPRIGPLVKSSASPLSTQSTLPGHSIVIPFIIKLEHNFKTSSTGDALKTQTARQSDIMITPQAKGADEALPTQTTCQGMGLAVPILTECRGNSTARPITDPAGAITAGGIHHGLLTTESWNSFLSSYNSRGHCLKHITDEMGAVTGTDRHSLTSFQKPTIDDCYYRMLKPGEVKRGMAFDDDYVILGNGRDQVKQCGNAVTPPVMEWLVERAIQSLS